MRYFIIFMSIFLIVQACPNPACNDESIEDDVKSVSDIRREQQLIYNLRSPLQTSANTEAEVEHETKRPSYNEMMAAKAEDLNLEKAMEEENKPMDSLDTVNKGKRQICNQILEQLKVLPCDNPLVLSCQGGGDEFPCGVSPSGSPLRAALADVDNILTGAESLQQPSVTFPSQISPIQTLPVSPSIAAANSITRPQPLIPVLPSLLRPSRILNEAERRERQKGIFEGLLRFGTVVNHVDSFLMDKSKMFIKGLSRMVESEEDKRFD